MYIWARWIGFTMFLIFSAFIFNRSLKYVEIKKCLGAIEVFPSNVTVNSSSTVCGPGKEPYRTCYSIEDSSSDRLKLVFQFCVAALKED